MSPLAFNTELASIQQSDPILATLATTANSISNQIASLTTQVNTQTQNITTAQTAIQNDLLSINTFQSNLSGTVQTLAPDVVARVDQLATDAKNRLLFYQRLLLQSQQYVQLQPSNVNLDLSRVLSRVSALVAAGGPAIPTEDVISAQVGLFEQDLQAVTQSIVQYYSQNYSPIRVPFSISLTANQIQALNTPGGQVVFNPVEAGLVPKGATDVRVAGIQVTTFNVAAPAVVPSVANLQLNATFPGLGRIYQGGYIYEFFFYPYPSSAQNPVVYGATKDLVAGTLTQTISSPATDSLLTSIVGSNQSLEPFTTVPADAGFVLQLQSNTSNNVPLTLQNATLTVLLDYVPQQAGVADVTVVSPPGVATVNFTATTDSFQRSAGVTPAVRRYSAGQIVNITAPAQVGQTSLAGYDDGQGNFLSTGSQFSATVNTSLTVRPVYAFSQSITFGPLSNVALASGNLTLSATSSSGLAVSYASTTTGVCTVTGNVVTLLSAGACSITATQAGTITATQAGSGSVNYLAAPNVVQGFTVTGAAQTISFASTVPASVVFGSGAVLLAATSNAPNPVFTFGTTSATAICTVAGTTVTLTGAGTCVLTVTASASGNFAAVTAPVTQNLQITAAAQTISFCPPLGPFPLTAGTFGVCATSSSGLAVGFSSTTTSVCTVSGNAVALLAAGTCTIQATQAGNANYTAASPVTQSFTIGAAVTTTTVSGILPEPSLIGQSYTISYTVTSSGGTPTGNVTVSDGSASATCTVAARNCALTSGTQGNKAITASYSGSGGFAASSASALHAVYSTSPLISTVAGNGNAGYSGDTGTAIGAQLRGPKTTVVDGSGNLYIADSLNNRIRRVDGFTGLISTVAGTGVATFSGDGSAAVSAGINQPGGLELDAIGNLYIADTGNNRVRKLTASTGVISTVAGNGTAPFSGDGSAATSAGISGPLGLALDASGNLYIADTGNNRVRKLTAATGVISTVAGNGTATFGGDGSPAVSAGIGGPSGIALDAANNLYIADTGNNRIREVNAATGVISTIAGNGNATFAGDNGSAVTAGLNGPSGIALDAANNIYVADTANNRVRKIDGTTGNVLTVAGAGNPVYNGDGGPAVNAGLNKPTGVGLDLSGNLYIADSANQAVRKVGGLMFGQTISFPALSGVTLGSSPITVSATASSGLAVAFASTTASVCALSGTTVTILGAGLCSITATQQGNGNYAAATPVVESFTVSAPSNASALAVGNGTGATGQAVEIPIQLTSTGSASPVGIQLDLSFDTSKLAFTSARIGPQSTTAGKSLSQNALPNGNERLLITGFNQNTISNGVVAYTTFTLGAQFTSGASLVTPLNCSATDGSGNLLATPCTAGTIRYLSCDIGHFGTTNVADVQLIINEALGVSPAADDLNGDGTVNVADVQIVINAALGLGCVL